MKLRQGLFYRIFLKEVDLFVHKVGGWKALSRRTASTIKDRSAEIPKIACKCLDTVINRLDRDILVL